MEEMIDVLDENGIKTGEILTRKDVHKKGIWHRVIVVAIIDNNNQLLMQQRSYKKRYKSRKMGYISSRTYISWANFFRSSYKRSSRRSRNLFAE